MIKALSQVARQRHMTFFSIQRNWSKKIKSAFLSSLIALFASAFIPSSGAGENEADNSSEPGSSQPQIKKIRLDDNSEVVIVKVTDDSPVLPEIGQWLKQCTSCIKQEPPDDDEKETNSSDTEFTVSPQDPPSVFQTVESGEKPFQCSLCQKYYKTAASLASHISASHSGERTCTRCQPPVTLNSAQALATHNQSHHSGERTCTRCQPPVTLNSAKALANHNRSHHSGAPVPGVSPR